MMERDAARWIDRFFRSRYLLPLLMLVTIAAIWASGRSLIQNQSVHENQSVQRADHATPDAARPSRIAAPKNPKPLRLAVYHFQPPDRNPPPLRTAPELEGPRLNNPNTDTNPEAYRPTINAPPLSDHSFAPRYHVDAEKQTPLDKSDRAEFVPQQSLPSAHIVDGGPGMEIVSRRAGVYVNKGFELAGRGALYSARTQFLLALRTIADALDAHSQTDHHAAALDAGLTALRESGDFHSSGAATSRRPLAVIVSSHRTPILRHLAAGPAVRVPGRVAAMQRYYNYAQQQLIVAGGRETTASKALYGLGKTSLAMQHSQDPGIIAGGPQALVLHQAALMVDSRNYMAANEVGVILTHCGQYHAARWALRHAAAHSNEASVWKNLSMVHEYLGETGLALQARRQVEIARLDKTRRPASLSPQQPVVWLESSEFAATSKFETDAKSVPATPHVDRQSSPQPNTPQAAQRRTPSKWFPSFGSIR